MIWGCGAICREGTAGGISARLRPPAIASSYSALS